MSITRIVRAAATAPLLTLALAVGPIALVAQVSPEPLTLAQALDLAQRNNPTFQASLNDREAADWDVRAAYGALLPSASASGGLSWQGAGEQQFGSLTADDLGFVDQPSFYFSNYSLSLNHQISGRTLLGPSQANAARANTEALISAARVNLETAVTNGYLEALRQRDGLELAIQELDRARFNHRLAEAQAEVGSATPLDVRQAEVQVGRAEVTLLLAENATETARLRLLQQMGVSLSQDIALVSEFEVDEPAWTEDALLDAAVMNNPTLESRRRSRDVAVVGVRMARTAYLPSLSLQAGWGGFTRQASSNEFLINQGQRQVASQINSCEATNELYRRLADPFPLADCSRFVFTDEARAAIIEGNSAFPFNFTGNPASARLTVSIPIFQGLSRQQQVESAHAQRSDAEFQLREQELALEADVRIQLARVRTAFRSADLERRNQELADEQLRLARERYRLGFIPFLDLVDAETVKVQADRDLLNAVYAYHDALTSLEAVVGRPLRTP